MKRCLAFLLLAIPLLLLSPLSPTAAAPLDPQAPTRIPPVLHAHVPGWFADYPVWVSASAAFRPDGELDEDLFPPTLASSLRALLSDPQLRVNGCVRLDEVWNDRVNPLDRSTLAKAVATSDLIVEGEVIEKDYGFQGFTAGQLLLVRAHEVVKDGHGLSEYFVFVPIGRFTAGPHTLCKSDSRYAGAPEIGDRVVLLVPGVGDPAEPYLHLQDAESLILLPGTARPQLPRAFERGSAAPPVQIDELLRTIRRLARPTAQE